MPRNSETTETQEPGLTTTKDFARSTTEPVKVTKRVDPSGELVVVTPLEDRKTCIGGTWYQLNRGEQIAIPLRVKLILANVPNLILEGRNGTEDE